MKDVQFNIPPLHAETIAVHLLIVLKNYLELINHQRHTVSTEPNALTSGELERLPRPGAGGAGSISDETLQLLGHLDSAYQKLIALSENLDDETPLPVSLTIPEAEAFIKVFTEETFEAAALKDEFYQKHSYPAYFAQIYSKYVEEVSEGYVEALAA